MTKTLRFGCGDVEALCGGAGGGVVAQPFPKLLEAVAHFRFDGRQLMPR